MSVPAIRDPHSRDHVPSHDGGLLEVEVRRNATLAGVLGALAGGFAVGWLARAATSGALLDWLVFAVLTLIAAGQLRSLVDARIPLVVADAQGLRLRMGREWRGLPWSAVEEVEVEPGRGPLRDGRLLIVPRDPERVTGGLDAAARRQVALSTRVYGAPLAYPLGLTTRASTPDLAGDLGDLAAGRCEIVEIYHGEEVEESDHTVIEPVVWDPVVSGASDEETRPVDVRALRDDEDLLAAEPDEDPAPAPIDPALPQRLSERLSAWRGRHDRGVSAEVDRDDASADVEVEVLTGRRETPEQTAPEQTAPEQTAPDVDAEIDAGIEAGPETGRDDEDLRDAHVGAVDRLRHRVGTALSRFADGRSHDVDKTGALDVAALRAAEAEAAAVVPVEPATPVEPTRPGRPAARVELVLDDPSRIAGVARVEELDPVEPPELEPSVPVRVQDPGAVVIVDGRSGPRREPVIGPRLAAARHRRGWSIEQLAERTAIRPHVIEALEVDDFEHCGGDFYARGHIKTLAEELRLPAEELLWEYRALYAGPEVDARQVFTAELAKTGGGIRSAGGGPRWGVLIGSVVALALAWGVARTFTDTAVEVPQDAPVVDQATLANTEPITSPKATPKRVTVRVVREPEIRDETGAVIAQEPVRVVVRDRNGDLMFAGPVAPGARRALVGLAPFTVRTADGDAVRVSVAGGASGAVGADGPARRVYR